MAVKVAELVGVDHGEARFTAAGVGLSAIVVKVGTGPVVVAAGGGVLSVTGGSAALRLFCGNLPVEPSLPPGYHVHFEHVGREWFVAAESVPLVLVVGGDPVPTAVDGNTHIFGL